METGFWTNSAGIPYTLLLRIEAIGFSTFGLLLYDRAFQGRKGLETKGGYFPVHQVVRGPKFRPYGTLDVRI